MQASSTPPGRASLPLKSQWGNGCHRKYRCHRRPVCLQLPSIHEYVGVSKRISAPQGEKYLTPKAAKNLKLYDKSAKKRPKNHAKKPANFAHKSSLPTRPISLGSC